MKKTILIILLVMVMISLLSACSVPASVTVDPAATPSDEASAELSATPSAAETVPEVSGTPAVTETESSATPSQPDVDIAAQTKEYLMHGQDDQPEAGKLQWTQPFLDQVDISAVYEQYLAGGGKAGDVADFAEYLTENAPVPSNWKELFEADLLAQYGMKPSSYEDLGDNYYQVYIMNEGKEVPFVGLNARTGYYHG